MLLSGWGLIFQDVMGTGGGGGGGGRLGVKRK